MNDVDENIIDKRIHIKDATITTYCIVVIVSRITLHIHDLLALYNYKVHSSKLLQTKHGPARPFWVQNNLVFSHHKNNFYLKLTTNATTPIAANLPIFTLAINVHHYYTFQKEN